MLDTLEKQFDVFVDMAQSVCLDTTIAENTQFSFKDVKTQGAWMIFGWAYNMGSKDMIVEVFK